MAFSSYRTGSFPPRQIHVGALSWTRLGHILPPLTSQASRTGKRPRHTCQELFDWSRSFRPKQTNTPHELDSWDETTRQRLLPLSRLNTPVLWPFWWLLVDKMGSVQEFQRSRPEFDLKWAPLAFRLEPFPQVGGRWLGRGAVRFLLPPPRPTVCISLRPSGAFGPADRGSSSATSRV